MKASAAARSELVVKTDENRRFVYALAFGNHCICWKGLVGPAGGDAFHDDLISGNARMFTHDGRLHDPLAVDHCAKPATPGSVDQCVRHRAAIKRRVIATVEKQTGASN